MTPLQTQRMQDKLSLPLVLQSLQAVEFSKIPSEKPCSADVKKTFPHTADQPLLRGKIGIARSSPSLRVAVVFSGGQAAGGHNVIAGLFDALKKLNPENRIWGFLGGPEGILKGNYRPILAEELANYRNQGGFDYIGSGRTKIETPEQMSLAAQTVESLQLDALVIVGGDDSNTNAALLAEYFLSREINTRVIGVPKTIDGDLKSEQVTISFGFDTACRVYSEIIGNIARDALSAQKYYHFIRLMGRSASHIALECALATHPNLVLIGEEIRQKNQTLKDLTQSMADLICERAENGKHFGVFLIPEGIIEFLPEMGRLIQELNQCLAKEEGLKPSDILTRLTPDSQACFAEMPDSIQQQLLLNRDPHGNVQVSFIETERLFMQMVGRELSRRKELGSYKGSFNSVSHFLGYEGRAAFPSLFDCHYCYVLGYTAALLAREGITGYMCFVQNLAGPVEGWCIGGVPLTRLIHFEMRKGTLKPVIQKALVDLAGKPFRQLEMEREAWRLEEAYRYPGPIQFGVSPEIMDARPLSINA